MIGSSSMPHKINPVKAERVSGLARVLRGNAMAALEDVPLWDERDLTHSSAERIIIQDSCLLADYMLQQMIDTLTTMNINHERMENNLDMTRGLIFSQRVLMALIEHDVPRSQAYEMVQRNALEAFNEQSDFAYHLLQDKEIMSVLSVDELDSLFDYEYYLKNLDYIYKKAGIF
jgi:adenylosuccinate lyase